MILVVVHCMLLQAANVVTSVATKLPAPKKKKTKGKSKVAAPVEHISDQDEISPEDSFRRFHQ